MHMIISPCRQQYKMMIMHTQKQKKISKRRKKRTRYGQNRLASTDSERKDLLSWNR